MDLSTILNDISISCGRDSHVLILLILWLSWYVRILTLLILWLSWYVHVLSNMILLLFS